MATYKREAEEQARKKAVRHRFCSLMRRVSYNRLWLVDAVEQKMTLNVHKNVGKFVRQHRQLGILTLPEKAMLRTDPFFRTVGSRKHLTNVFLGLSCFSTIPPVLRARMVKVMIFMYVEAGRTVIREGQNPMAVYFILTGQLEMRKRYFDELAGEYFDKIVFIFGPGDMIGEAEMIERTKRRNSYVTATECQFLYIQEQEFDEILRPLMSKRWFDKKTALYRLGYFEFFNDEQILTACKLSVLKQFDPLDTIYAEDKGHLTPVHFVTCGECIILQRLEVKAVTSKTGKQRYELVEVTDSKSDSIFHKVSQSELFSLGGHAHQEDEAKNFINKLLQDEEEIYAKKTKRDSETALKRAEKVCMMRELYSPQKLAKSFNQFDDSDHDIEEAIEAESESDYESETVSSSISSDDDISEDVESMDPYEKMQRQNIDYYDEEMALWRKLRKLDTDKKLAKAPKLKEGSKFARERQEEERRLKEIEKKLAEEKRRERHAKREERFLRALEAKEKTKSAASKKQSAKQKAFGKQENTKKEVTSVHEQDQVQNDAEEHNAEQDDKDQYDKEQNPSEQKNEKNIIIQQPHRNQAKLNVKAKLSQAAKPKSPAIAETKRPQEKKNKAEAEIKLGKSRVAPTDPSSSTKQKEENIHNNFVDVGSLTFGGIFGLGEHMDHRIIMARTSVQCLTLPRFWLLSKQQNPGNVWNRRRCALDVAIPSRESIHKDCQTSLRWESYRKRLVKRLIGPGHNNPTKKEDVPVILRILE